MPGRIGICGDDLDRTFCRKDGAAVCGIPDKEQIAVAGYVDWKEYRLSRDTKTPVIYLSDVTVLKQSQMKVLENLLSDSEKIPNHSLHSFWKENKENLRREDAGEWMAFCAI